MKKIFEGFDLNDKGYLTRREYFALAYYIGREPILNKEKIFFDELQFKNKKLNDEIIEFFGGDDITKESIGEAFRQLEIDDVDIKAFYDYFKKFYLN